MNCFKLLFGTLVLLTNTSFAIAGDDGRQASQTSSQRTIRPNSPAEAQRSAQADPGFIINDPNYKGASIVVMTRRSNAASAGQRSSQQQAQPAPAVTTSPYTDNNTKQ